MATPEPTPDGENGEPKLAASTVNKINEIMAIFEQIAKIDKKIKDARGKLADTKKLSQRALATNLKSLQKLEDQLEDKMRQIDFTPQTRNRMINKLRDIDGELHIDGNGSLIVCEGATLHSPAEYGMSTEIVK